PTAQWGAVPGASLGGAMPTGGYGCAGGPGMPVTAAPATAVTPTSHPITFSSVPVASAPAPTGNTLRVFERGGSAAPVPSETVPPYIDSPLDPVDRTMGSILLGSSVVDAISGRKRELPQAGKDGVE